MGRQQSSSQLVIASVMAAVGAEDTIARQKHTNINPFSPRAVVSSLFPELDFAGSIARYLSTEHRTCEIAAQHCRMINDEYSFLFEYARRRPRGGGLLTMLVSPAFGWHATHVTVALP